MGAVNVGQAVVHVEHAMLNGLPGCGAVFLFCSSNNNASELRALG